MPLAVVLSILSILCHFHGLLWKRVSQSQNHRESPFWEQEPKFGAPGMEMLGGREKQANDSVGSSC
jgi:hypothetical protein